MSEPASLTRVSPWLYWSILPIHRGFIRLYFGPITITGREHLPNQGPLVLAPKHFSRWDPLILWLLSRQPLKFMTNANQFSGAQGWLIRRLGAFPVEIARPQFASLRYTVELLHTRTKLVIFPEGGIARDQPLRPLKPGLARLVLQAEATAPCPLRVPIIPIALRYEPGAQFGAKVFVHICPPLSSEDYPHQDDKETAQALTQGLQTSLLAGLAATRSPKI